MTNLLAVAPGADRGSHALQAYSYAITLSMARRGLRGSHPTLVHPVEEADGWVVVEEWLTAERLEPV